MRLIKFTGKYERKGKKGTQARKKGATEIIVDQKSGPALAGPPDRRRRPCFPAGDNKAHINRRAQRHGKHKTEKKPIKDLQKKYRLGTVSKIFYKRALTAPTSPLTQMWIKTHRYLVCIKDP